MRRRASHVKHRINDTVSSMIWQALRHGKIGRRWESLVGYTLADLMRHLERLFVGGMSWENFGDWHIDHVRPRAAFEFTSVDSEAFKQCWSLSNLQPLWAIDNLKKRAKEIDS
jgi:hypothetical protein